MREMKHTIIVEPELRRIREKRKTAQRYHYQQSKLAPWRAELVALRLIGASYVDIAYWLKEQRLIVAVSTISRYLAKLPELQGCSGGES